MSFVAPEEVVGHLRLADKMIVADLGTGSGAYVFALAHLFTREHIRGATTYAVDVQKALLERLRSEATHRGYSGIETIWADVEVPGGVKLADQICDAVIVSNLLFQVQDKAALAKEAARILKPSGQMLVLDWSDKLPAQTAKDLFTALGFQIKKEFNAGSHHWGLLLQKT